MVEVFDRTEHAFTILPCSLCYEEIVKKSCFDYSNILIEVISALYCFYVHLSYANFLLRFLIIFIKMKNGQNGKRDTYRQQHSGTPTRTCLALHCPSQGYLRCDVSLYPVIKLLQVFFYRNTVALKH